MKRKQGGMTLMSFVVVLAVVGFAAYIGMNLFPMYSEFYSVKKALKRLQQEPGIANQDPSKIRDMLFRNFDISYVDSVKPENVKLERAENGGGWKIDVDYEVRKPLVGNLDVVAKFHDGQLLSNAGDGT